MAQFNGAITDRQADAIVAAIWFWVVGNLPGNVPIEVGRSMVAAIVCDAVHADITLQPLHEAYGRKAGYQL